MFERVLIPVDDSAMSERAAAFAARLSPRAASLLRVEPNFQVLRPGPLQDFRPDWREVVSEQVAAEMQPIVEPLRQRGVPVDLLVRFGDPATEIIEAAADADLVVMSTHGRSAAGRAFFGSVADRVVRHGATPTLLVRGGQHPVSADETTRIVVPLDGSELAEAAVPVAARLASELKVPVHLVQVVEATTGTGETSGDARAGAEEYLKTQAARLAAAGVTASSAVETGGAVTVLLDLLRPTDLLVMTTLGQGGLRRWLIGSVADKLVREAVSPVLVVRAGVDSGPA